MRVWAGIAALCLPGCAHHLPRHHPGDVALFETVAAGKPTDAGFHLWIGANGWFVGELHDHGVAGPITMGAWTRDGAWFTLRDIQAGTEEAYLLLSAGGRTFFVRDTDLVQFCGDLSREGMYFRLWKGAAAVPPAPLAEACAPA